MQQLLNHTTALRGSLSASLVKNTRSCFYNNKPYSFKCNKNTVKIKTTHFTTVALRGQTHCNLANGKRLQEHTKNTMEVKKNINLPNTTEVFLGMD